MSKLSNYIFSGETLTYAQARGAGYLMPYGSGHFRTFFNDATFVVPPGVTSIRVRVHGAGGGGTDDGEPGGSSSFGQLISATGGEGGGKNTSGSTTGGIGVGGDYQSQGGSGGNGTRYDFGGGGGGAASILGNGSSGGEPERVSIGQFYELGGVGGGVGNSQIRRDSEKQAELGMIANSAYGGKDALGGYELDPLKESELQRFPMESFGGRGGLITGRYFNFNSNTIDTTLTDGGPGGGSLGGSFEFGGSRVLMGKPGPGGGTGGYTSQITSGFSIESITDVYPTAGIGGGAGGLYIFSTDSVSRKKGGAGGGFAIGVFSVSPGDEFPVTVGQGGYSDNRNIGSSLYRGKGGDGLVVVEW